MTIRHHLSDDILADHAAGSLAEGWSLAASTHLALCPHCRRHLAELEELGGALLEALPAGGMEETSLAAVMARITTDDASEMRRPQRTGVSTPPVLPEPLRAYVGSDAEGIRWKPLGRGAAQLKIATKDRSTQVRLLRIPAGKPVPEHGHRGRELTVVLSGAFRDGEKLFARGDVEDADASLTHQPVATPEADCICLAVTDAPLRFTHWLVRIMQPVLGI
jgi:putative transcriptional regulator